MEVDVTVGGRLETSSTGVMVCCVCVALSALGYGGGVFPRAALC